MTLSHAMYLSAWFFHLYRLGLLVVVVVFVDEYVRFFGDIL